jgi:hypothetical protein
VAVCGLCAAGVLIATRPVPRPWLAHALINLVTVQEQPVGAPDVRPWAEPEAAFDSGSSGIENR